jgi:hypothetical protein
MANVMGFWKYNIELGVDAFVFTTELVIVDTSEKNAGGSTGLCMFRMCDFKLLGL